MKAATNLFLRIHKYFTFYYNLNIVHKKYFSKINQCKGHKIDLFVHVHKNYKYKNNFTV